MKLIFVALALLVPSAHAANLSFNETDVSQAFKIDFNKSELKFDKNNKLEELPMKNMERIANDHAQRIKGELTGVSLNLNPILNNKQYSYFFTFNLKSNFYSPDKKDLRDYNCFAVTNKNFTHYSAACAVVKK